jgi:hypothetical protein
MNVTGALVNKSHADCSPSASSIWLACPASVTKARGRSRKATVYTREGTAAHSVAEMVLKGQAGALPETVRVDDEVIPVTEEMLDGVETYADIIREAGRFGDLSIEKRVSVDVGGEPLWGTSDAFVVFPQVGHVDVFDLKYGAGVAVEAASSQMKIYGLGVMEAVAPFHEIGTIGLNVIQPRMPDPVRRVVLPAGELLRWKEGTLVPAVRRIEDGDTTETAGDHCRWCVRAAECKGLAAFVQDKAKVTFGGGPPEATALTDGELGFILDNAEVIAAWIAKVRAEASDRVDKGGTIPGWKLVPRRAQRKWADAGAARDAITDLVGRGVPVLDIVRIETITTVEKVLKRLRLKVTLDPFTVKESSGNTLVSEKDGREAIDTSARGVFSNPM